MSAETPEPTQPAPEACPGGNRRYLKATLAGGAGGLLTLLFFLLEERPELVQLLLERVVIAWGPQFVIVLLLFAFLYLLADRYAPRLIQAQSETALALQTLAGAVQQLVARDDAFQREQDVLLNHVARRVDSLHQLLESRLGALNFAPEPPAAPSARLSRLPGAQPRGAKGRPARKPRPGRPPNTAPRKSRRPSPARPAKSSPPAAPASG